MTATEPLEAIVEAVANTIIKAIDADWISDEIDNRLIDLSSFEDPESEAAMAAYDDQFGRAMRDITLRALGSVLTTLGTGVPNP